MHESNENFSVHLKFYQTKTHIDGGNLSPREKKSETGGVKKKK